MCAIAGGDNDVKINTDETNVFYGIYVVVGRFIFHQFFNFKTFGIASDEVWVETNTPSLG